MFLKHSINYLLKLDHHLKTVLQLDVIKIYQWKHLDTRFLDGRRATVHWMGGILQCSATVMLLVSKCQKYASHLAVTNKFVHMVKNKIAA